ncbi:MAG: hypothetical protein ACTHU0_32125 [Kofleriaceae bacterium]
MATHANTGRPHLGVDTRVLHDCPFAKYAVAFCRKSRSCGIALQTVYRQQFLTIAHTRGTLHIGRSLLSSAAAFEELHRELVSRWKQQARSSTDESRLR